MTTTPVLEHSPADRLVAIRTGVQLLVLFLCGLLVAGAVVLGSSGERRAPLAERTAEATSAG